MIRRGTQGQFKRGRRSVRVDAPPLCHFPLHQNLDRFVSRAEGDRQGQGRSFTDPSYVILDPRELAGQSFEPGRVGFELFPHLPGQDPQVGAKRQFQGQPAIAGIALGQGIPVKLEPLIPLDIFCRVLGDRRAGTVAGRRDRSDGKDAFATPKVRHPVAIPAIILVAWGSHRARVRVDNAEDGQAAIILAEQASRDRLRIAMKRDMCFPGIAFGTCR